MKIPTIKRAEKRSTLEDPSVSPTAENFLQSFGMANYTSKGGTVVTIDAALSIPAIWCAVNFIASTLASLPLHVYDRTGDDRKRVRDGIADILGFAVNDEMTSFAWRYHFFMNVLTGGRGFTFIERNQRDQIINLWPLDPSKVTIVRRSGRTFYEYRDGNRTLVYEAREIIDLAFMMQGNSLKHRGPLAACAHAIGLMIDANSYASNYFNNGGVPPYVVTGNFQNKEALKRAAEEFESAIKDVLAKNRNAFTLPSGMDIKTVGSDPDKSQLIETKRFGIEEAARIYQLPPAFLQDLTGAKFNNVEQQDLHLTKHTIRRWVNQLEQELNLKLFGRSNRGQFVEFNMDGLLRGDFKTRMEGYATGITHGVLKPNEARRRENLSDAPEGNHLFIQGGTFPITYQLNLPVPQAGAASKKEGDDEA
jgi:HK97 family phage portal protein